VTGAVVTASIAWAVERFTAWPPRPPTPMARAVRRPGHRRNRFPHPAVHRRPGDRDRQRHEHQCAPPEAATGGGPAGGDIVPLHDMLSADHRLQVRPGDADGPAPVVEPSAGGPARRRWSPTTRCLLPATPSWRTATHGVGRHKEDDRGLDVTNIRYSRSSGGRACPRWPGRWYPTRLMPPDGRLVTVAARHTKRWCGFRRSGRMGSGCNAGASLPCVLPANFVCLTAGCSTRRDGHPRWLT
jgi:hypothetical protein